METNEISEKALDALELLEKLIRKDAEVDDQLELDELFDSEPFDGKVERIFADYNKGIRVGEREVDFIASTDDMDSDGDIVEQEFIFDRFLKNPVILFGHNSRALPIGQAINPRVEGGMLKMTVKFASKRANPIAEQVFLLIKEKVLRAMSIGFRPKEIRRERRDDKEVFILSQNELLESSVVTIPANPNALVEMKNKALKAFQGSPLTPPSEQAKSTDGGREFDMNEQDQKALTTKVAELETKVAQLEASNKALTEEKDVHAERYKALEDLYNAEKAKSNEAELAVVERDVDELIGKKIDANEKASLMKLAAVNRELFDENLEALKNRPDMQLREQSVLPPAALPPAQPTPAEKASGTDFNSMINRRAGLAS